MYNFGSPRVGNKAFADLCVAPLSTVMKWIDTARYAVSLSDACLKKNVRFNKVVPDAFRVVNDADVVARVPRSSSHVKPTGSIER